MLTKIRVVYSTVLTTLLAAFTLAGSAAAKVQRFDEIDVHRLNVREPDGTLRMVISNHTRLPGVIVRGKENPPADRPYAGMLFYNDEGTENGGLVFGGTATQTARWWMLVWPSRSIATERPRNLFNSPVCKTQRTTSLGSRCRRPSPQAIGGVSSSATIRRGSPACRSWTAMGESESCYRSHLMERPVFRF